MKSPWILEEPCLTGSNGDGLFVRAAAAADSLCVASHSCCSRWPWLSAAFYCTLPVIACQINVPLCSQAQKLSSATLAPLLLVLFNAAPPPVRLPSSLPSAPLCACLFSRIVSILASPFPLRRNLVHHFAVSAVCACSVPSPETMALLYFLPSIFTCACTCPSLR